MNDTMKSEEVYDCRRAIGEEEGNREYDYRKRRERKLDGKNKNWKRVGR